MGQLPSDTSYTRYPNRMKLSLEPGEVPFKVGDTLVVNLPYHTLAEPIVVDTDNKPYFQAEVIRIFLEFPTVVSVIKERKDIHHFAVTSITYDLKPLGFYEGAGRVTLRLDLTQNEKLLFATEEDLFLER